MLEHIYNISLFFFNFHFIAPLIILGAAVNRRIFLNAALIAFLGAFINAYLKSLWRIPLDPSVTTVGWAFPSGHTHFNITLWLCILYYIRNPWVISSVAAMMVVYCFAMVHFHFHNWWDIQIGALCGALNFLLLPLWERFANARTKQLELAIMVTCASLGIYMALPHDVLSYNWLLIYFGLYVGLLCLFILERLSGLHMKQGLSYRRLPEMGLILLSIYLIGTIPGSMAIYQVSKGALLVIVPLIIIPFLFNALAAKCLKQT